MQVHVRQVACTLHQQGPYGGCRSASACARSRHCSGYTISSSPDFATTGVRVCVHAAPASGPCTRVRSEVMHLSLETGHIPTPACRYFRRLQLRYKHLSLPQSEVAAEAGEGGSPSLTPEQRDASRRVPIAVVNLLRKGSMDRDRSEAKLYSAFCDLMAALQRECGMDIVNIGLDWHELASTHGGLAPVVQILWGATERYLRQFGFTKGRFVDAATADAAKDETVWGYGLAARRERRQQGVFRFNCADSLDRTNVASYYSAFQVLLEQAREMGLQLVGHRYEGMLPGPGGVPMRDVGVSAGAGRGVQKATKLLGTFASRMGSMAQGMMTSTSGSNLSGMGKRGGGAQGAASPVSGANGGSVDTPAATGVSAVAAALVVTGHLLLEGCGLVVTSTSAIRPVHPSQ